MPNALKYQVYTLLTEIKKNLYKLFHGSIISLAILDFIKFNTLKFIYDKLIMHEAYVNHTTIYIIILITNYIWLKKDCTI